MAPHPLPTPGTPAAPPEGGDEPLSLGAVVAGGLPACTLGWGSRGSEVGAGSPPRFWGARLGWVLLTPPDLSVTPQMALLDAAARPEDEGG